MVLVHTLHLSHRIDGATAARCSRMANRAVTRRALRLRLRPDMDGWQDLSSRHTDVWQEAIAQ